MKQSSIVAADDDREGDHYPDFAQGIRVKFDSVVGPLFTTNAQELFRVFLNNLPAEGRQHYNCHCCRHFIERYGGLVSVDEKGVKTSALWSKDQPEFFQKAVNAMLKVIDAATIDGVFVSSETVYGQPQTGAWHHMHVAPNVNRVWNSLTVKDHQRAAELREDFKMLIAGILAYPPDAVKQAVKLLKSDALYRSEKVLGVAEWLLALHEARNAVKRADVRNNLTWLAVATAPAGFCHVKSTMISTLLDDTVTGMDFSEISSRFAKKMDGLAYQRPQVAPSAGNIARAEKIIEKLQAAGSLDRRFARLDEIQTVWKPTPKTETPAGDGVFSHLIPKGAPKSQGAEVQAPATTITWDKFQRTVLPDAISIELRVDGSPNSYCAFVTASNPDSAPILQWDSMEQRNPFSWYFHGQPSRPATWNLNTGLVRVNAISLKPSMWYGEFDHQGKGVMFILDGCKDETWKLIGNAIFPEILKSEFHGIRSTIEAYSRGAKLFGADEASACGIMKHAGQDGWNIILRVVTKLGVTNWKLDRWD